MRFDNKIASVIITGLILCAISTNLSAAEDVVRQHPPLPQYILPPNFDALSKMTEVPGHPLTAPALASTDPIADVDAAVNDGFMPLEIPYGKLQPAEEYNIIEDQFVAKIGATVGRVPPLSFDYLLIDLDNDGFRDLILFPMIYELPAAKGFDGANVYIYKFDGKLWHLSLEAGAMVIAIKPEVISRKLTGRMELALIQLNGYRRFRFSGNELVEMKDRHTKE